MENREKKETENTNCDTAKDKNVINNDDFSSKNKVDSQAIGLSSDKESQEACKVVKNGKYASNYTQITLKKGIYSAQPLSYFHNPLINTKKPSSYSFQLKPNYGWIKTTPTTSLSLASCCSQDSSNGARGFTIFWRASTTTTRTTSTS